MSRSAFKDGTPRDEPAHKRYCVLSNRTCEGYLPMVRNEAQTIAKHLKDCSVIGIAEVRRRLDQCAEYPVHIECRAANDLEYIGGGGLLLKGLAQRVEQTSVLDCDHRLTGEVADQIDLLLRKRADFLPVDGYGAKHFL